jgi:hypothetical protein
VSPKRGTGVSPKMGTLHVKGVPENGDKGNGISVPENGDKSSLTTCKPDGGRPPALMVWSSPSLTELEYTDDLRWLCAVTTEMAMAA